MWSPKPPEAPGWYWISLTVPGGVPALTIGKQPGSIEDLREFATLRNIRILYWTVPIDEPPAPALFLCDECHARDHVVADCPIVVRRTGGLVE